MRQPNRVNRNVKAALARVPRPIRHGHIQPPRLPNGACYLTSAAAQDSGPHVRGIRRNPTAGIGGLGARNPRREVAVPLDGDAWRRSPAGGHVERPADSVPQLGSPVGCGAGGSLILTYDAASQPPFPTPADRLWFVRSYQPTPQDGKEAAMIVTTERAKRQRSFAWPYGIGDCVSLRPTNSWSPLPAIPGRHTRQ